MLKILSNINIITVFLISILSAQIQDSEFSSEKRMKLQNELSSALFNVLMEAKSQVNELEIQTREELLSNLSSTAPRTEFIINADISSDLGSGVLSSSVNLSINGQQSWLSTNEVNLLGTNGFEETWQGSIQNSGSNAVHWFISAMVNSEVLDQDFGNIIVSQSPNNINGTWPPPNNLYTTIAYDPSGDASAGQDITSIFASYKGPYENPEGNTENLYLGMNLSGGCCDYGYTFGPWYLYGIGIVNPEAETQVAYAVGYGDGGFGELTPGILKLTGDLSSGAISGFEYLTTYIDWTAMGNQLHTSLLMDYIVNDPDWGPWPNSMNGVILLGVTVSADINSNVTVIDQSDPGLFILSSQTQSGNSNPNISNFNFTEANSTVSVDYLDSENNVPWKHSVSICSEFDVCANEFDLIPNSHEYSAGVTYSASIDINQIEPSDYLKVSFNDSDLENQELTLYDFISFEGCTDPSACNYVEGMSGCELGDNSCCDYAPENVDCLGNCISEIDCFGICGGGAIVDECGICDGSDDCNCPGFPDGTTPDCFGECGGTAIFDECDVCGGTGVPNGFCDCEGHVEDICGVCGGNGVPDGFCDCNENILDCTGECGGGAEIDDCGICQGDDACVGCMDDFALNYDIEATINENCDYNIATNLTANFNTENESVNLSWFAPETGPIGPCSNEGEILDCYGNCAPESWLSDGACDDGTYFYSVTYGYCGTDPLNLPAEDCISIVLDCEEFPEEGDDCVDEGCPVDYVMDCLGVCTPYAWIGDGYCDVGQWGSFLYCESGSWDGGDCGSCSDLNNVQDCNGDCWPYNVIGDGWCDEDGYVNWDPFNFEEDFDCSAFGYDGGDCSGEPEITPNDDNHFVRNKLPVYLSFKNNDITNLNPMLREEIEYRIVRNDISISEISETNFIDLAPVFGDNCYSIITLYPYGESESTENVCVFAELNSLPGDANMDGDINVVDIVMVVGFIMNENSELNLEAVDMNNDGIINVIDIVQIVGIILDD